MTDIPTYCTICHGVNGHHDEGCPNSTARTFWDERPKDKKEVKMPEKVEVTLPAGMTEEGFMKAFESFQKSRVATTVRDKAVRSATKDLIAMHKADYDRLLAKYTPKA